VLTLFLNSRIGDAESETKNTRMGQYRAISWGNGIQMIGYF